MSWFRARWIDIVTAIYIYNEHRGYTALDKVLYAVRRHFPDDHRLIAQIERHRADEHKHYLMFKRWFEKRGVMPLFVDRACGHIDRFVELIFGKRIDELDLDRFIEDGNFEELCRVISLTEQRGYRQVEILLRHPAILEDRSLTKIFQVIKQDEPSHWAPYDSWLKRHRRREPKWWEHALDSLIHSELLFVKLPLLFFSADLKRRDRWPDENDRADTLARYPRRAPGSIRSSTRSLSA